MATKRRATKKRATKRYPAYAKRRARKNPVIKTTVAELKKLYRAGLSDAKKVKRSLVGNPATGAAAKAMIPSKPTLAKVSKRPNGTLCIQLLVKRKAKKNPAKKAVRRVVRRKRK